MYTNCAEQPGWQKYQDLQFVVWFTPVCPVQHHFLVILQPAPRLSTPPQVQNVKTGSVGKICRKVSDCSPFAFLPAAAAVKWIPALHLQAFLHQPFPRCTCTASSSEPITAEGNEAAQSWCEIPFNRGLGFLSESLSSCFTMTKNMFCLKEAQSFHTDSSLQPHSSSQSRSQILKNFKPAKDSDHARSGLIRH